MITVYASDANDFGALGLGVLTPSSAIVEEKAGGLYELTVVQPIDDSYNDALLTLMRILKADVPFRESPKVTAQAGTITRAIYQTNVACPLRATSGGKILKNLKSGTKVAQLSASGGAALVTLLDGGLTGYVVPGKLTFVENRTEVITGDTPGAVIRPKQTREQLFRIYRLERDSQARTVTAYAQHISYDLKGYIVGQTYSPENAAVSEVLTQLLSKLDRTMSGFTITCTATGNITADYTGKSLLNCLLDPDDGIAAQLNARVVRDNYDIYILPDTERDCGVTIEYGKNLLKAVLDSDVGSLVTRIQPVGKFANGNDLYITDNNGYVDSSTASPITIAKRIEYDVKEGSDSFPTLAEARAELKRLAQLEFSQNGIDAATVSLDADFVRLELTAQYQALANAYALHIYDTVPIKDTDAGINASVRMTGYTYDCLLDKYSSTTLGDIDELNTTVYGYEIASGSVSGSKLITGSVSGDRLKNLSVDYAKISSAAITSLKADSVTAYRADIANLAAQEIKTDALVANIAKVLALHVEDLTASSVTADRLGAALAAFSVVTAGTATFDEATVRHLIASALNVTDATADKVFISNLAIDYANIVSANVGHLCIKAEDGNYYALSVDSSGNVTATQTTVTSSEIEAGVTTGGRTIIDTEIVASDLSASNLKAVYALINRIDAARIDVDVLTAREAWISWLHTADISSNTSIKLALESTQKVHRSETAPTSANINDLWVVPSTGFTYQLTESEADTNDYSFSVTSDGVLQHTSPASPGYTMALEDGELSVTYDGTGQVLFALDDDGNIQLTTASWKRVKDGDLTAAEQIAVNAANKADANGEQLDVINRYMEFDDDGLKQYLPGSPYYTLVDNDGFYVKSTQKADAIVSMDAADGVVTQSQRMGNITCKATTTGGWVWQAAT